MVIFNNTLKTYADQKFISFGGYSEITKYISTKTLINTLFFHGQTLFLTPFKTETASELSYDLQLYGYIPNTPLHVLNEDFILLNTFIVKPSTVQGQIVYIFAYSDPEEQNLLFQKHATRLLFSFKTHNKNNLIEVISSTEYSPSSKKSFLEQEKSLLAINNITNIIQDNITILLKNHSVSFFKQEQSFPSNFLFSPLNESIYSDDDININTNKNIIFSICQVVDSDFSSLIGLTKTQLIINLSSLHTKIYWNELTNTEYWLHNSFSYRLKIKLEENIVVSSSKQSLTKLSFTSLSSTGDTSRVKNLNGIYILRSTNNSDKSINMLATL